MTGHLRTWNFGSRSQVDLKSLLSPPDSICTANFLCFSAALEQTWLLRLSVCSYTRRCEASLHNRNFWMIRSDQEFPKNQESWKSWKAAFRWGHTTHTTQSYAMPSFALPSCREICNLSCESNFWKALAMARREHSSLAKDKSDMWAFVRFCEKCCFPCAFWAAESA